MLDHVEHAHGAACFTLIQVNQDLHLDSVSGDFSCGASHGATGPPLDKMVPSEN